MRYVIGFLFEPKNTTSQHDTQKRTIHYRTISSRVFAHVPFAHVGRGVPVIQKPNYASCRNCTSSYVRHLFIFISLHCQSDAFATHFVFSFLGCLSFLWRKKTSGHVNRFNQHPEVEFWGLSASPI